jgi:hypothetical protein
MQSLLHEGYGKEKHWILHLLFSRDSVDAGGQIFSFVEVTMV